MGQKQRDYENWVSTVRPSMHMQLTAGLWWRILNATSLTMVQQSPTMSRQAQTALWFLSQYGQQSKKQAFLEYAESLFSIWSIPSYALTTDWQAKKLDVTARQLANLGGKFIAKAEASKRAAQIFAEMLGLVCHRGFIEIGEQMVKSLLNQFLHRCL